MAISAAVAVGPAGDDLLSVLDTKARAVQVGPSRSPESEMGPIITRESRDRIVGLITAGEGQGAEVRVDGRDLVVAGHEEGFFVGPTVLDRVETSMDVYTNEIFGPVLSVLRTDDLEAALRMINANPYGNGTAVFTRSGSAARRFVRGVNVGMVGVNVPVPVPMAYYSFGGWKDSLFGEHHMHGPEGVAFYTRGKAVTVRWPDDAERQRVSLDMPTAR
jgi:malonate-semialdehyde dehydrogenase (acetylating)/methylmalonate-semialdehyde dehydrogenase